MNSLFAAAYYPAVILRTLFALLAYHSLVYWVWRPEYFPTLTLFFTAVCAFWQSVENSCIELNDQWVNYLETKEKT